MGQDKQNEKKDIDIHQHFRDGIIDFTAGIVGGIVIFVAHPLDTVKVKMQLFPNMYRNMFICFVETLKHDGLVKGLYAGAIPAMMANVSEYSIVFMAYGYCKKAIAELTHTEKIDELSVLNQASAGCLASFFSTLASTPLELVKCKLQASYEVQKQQALKGIHVDRIGGIQMVRIILREDGPRGLFRGLIPTLAREMPGYFIFFGGYEATREFFRKEGQTKDDIGILRTFFSGSVAGAVCWISTYPFDIAKSQIQVNKVNDPMLRVIVNIYKEHGISGLFCGLSPTLIRTIPATATLMGTVEYTKQFLHYMFP